jgi:hypothetical protein
MYPFSVTPSHDPVHDRCHLRRSLFVHRGDDVGVRSIVIVMDECPSRSWTTLGWMPACSSSVAWVRRRSWNRMAFTLTLLTALPNWWLITSTSWIVPSPRAMTTRQPVAGRADPGRPCVGAGRGDWRFAIQGLASSEDPCLCVAPFHIERRTARDSRCSIQRVRQLGPATAHARPIGLPDISADWGGRRSCPARRRRAILGFVQMEVQSAVMKPRTPTEANVEHLRLATAWNQIEGGVLYALRLPLLVFRERGVAEGIFEKGSSELFIQELPVPWDSQRDPDRVREVLLKWQGEVRTRYHGQG